MNQNTSRSQIQLTDTPAPWMPGLYSVQVIPKASTEPSVTHYRSRIDDALSLVKAQASKREHEWLLLRHAEAAWDVYDRRGKLTHLCDEISLQQRTESTLAVSVAPDMMDVQAIAATGLPVSRICLAEGHAGASAAALSNFIVTCRELLIEAPEKDVEHLYCVEGVGWPCRVLGLYAHADKLSMKTVDRWMDRYRRLASNTPLNRTHYIATLRRHLANARRDYVAAIVNQVMDLQGLPESEKVPLRFFLMEYNFCQTVVDWLVDNLGDRFKPMGSLGIECLPQADIVANAPELVSLLRRQADAPRQTAGVM